MGPRPPAESLGYDKAASLAGSQSASSCPVTGSVKPLADPPPATAAVAGLPVIFPLKLLLFDVTPIPLSDAALKFIPLEEGAVFPPPRALPLGIGGLTTGLTVALPPLPVILPPFVLDPDPESAPGWHDAGATGLVKLLLHKGLPPTLGEIEDWWPLNCK